MKFQQIKPQKARGKFVESMWSDLDWVAEPKYDGDRRIMQIVGGRVHLTGCRESVDGTGFIDKAANVPHISKLPKSLLRDLEGTILDGEMVYTGDVRGSGSKYVTAVMGSKPGEAIRKQREGGELVYYVFDCLWSRGKDVRREECSERYQYVWKAVEETLRAETKLIAVVESYRSEVEKRGLFSRESEGVVFKHVAHTYGNEKLWVKLKKQATADVVITGFTAGKGKFAGMVGAVQFGQYLLGGCFRSCGQCSGMDDATRIQITAAPAKFVGQVMEIKHYGREPSGHFRHPQFLRFRPDKAAKDCVMREDET